MASLLTGQILAATGFAALSSITISLLLALWSRERWQARGLGEVRTGAPQTVFLFEDGRLVDATPGARQLLKGIDRRSGDLAALAVILGDRFGPDLPARLARLREGEQLALAATGGDGLLEAEAEEGALRLALHLDDPGLAIGRLALEAAEAELARLRALADDAPTPIWALDATGSLAWANRAYLDLSDLVRPAAEGRGGWPATLLFDPPSGLAEGQVETRRLPLALADRPRSEWFEVCSVRRGPGTVHFATDVGRLVAAEAAHSSFVQTLTRAFAHLPTGLAVFDRQRHLVLFNPAFADLTGLTVTFLSGRPLIHTVLDRLRETQVLPEPRNYASWRDEIAALEAAASSGHYCETWTQPDGRTFRVAGRPHADGALAFLVTDITDEIAFARRANGELDVMRAVLDSLGEAVAVFSAAGTLSLTNAAYDRLWAEDPAPDEALRPYDPTHLRLAESGLRAEVARWEAAFGPHPAWTALRDGRSIGAGTSRIDVPGGRRLALRIVELPGGGLSVAMATMPAALASHPVAILPGDDLLPSPSAGAGATDGALPGEPIRTGDRARLAR